MHNNVLKLFNAKKKECTLADSYGDKPVPNIAAQSVILAFMVIEKFKENTVTLKCPGLSISTL